MSEIEVLRVKDFTGGGFTCVRCGETIQLFWNGGELSSRACCGLVYAMEHQRTDLVIYEVHDDIEIDEELFKKSIETFRRNARVNPL